VVTPGVVTRRHARWLRIIVLGGDKRWLALSRSCSPFSRDAPPDVGMAKQRRELGETALANMAERRCAAALLCANFRLRRFLLPSPSAFLLLPHRASSPFLLPWGGRLEPAGACFSPFYGIPAGIIGYKLATFFSTYPCVKAWCQPTEPGAVG